MKRWQVLWTVFELSLKWRRLRLRVEKRVDAFHESESLYSTEPEVLHAIHTCIEQMREAMTPEVGSPSQSLLFFDGEWVSSGCGCRKQKISIAHGRLPQEASAK